AGGGGEPSTSPGRWGMAAASRAAPTVPSVEATSARTICASPAGQHAARPCSTARTTRPTVAVWLWLAMPTTTDASADRGLSTGTLELVPLKAIGPDGEEV